VCEGRDNGDGRGDGEERRNARSCRRIKSARRRVAKGGNSRTSVAELAVFLHVDRVRVVLEESVGETKKGEQEKLELEA
jgi:hypothetical protein